MQQESVSGESFDAAEQGYAEVLNRHEEKMQLPRGALNAETIRGILHSIENDNVLAGSREMYDWRRARAAEELNAIEGRLRSPLMKGKERAALLEQQKLLVYRLNNFERNQQILEWNAHLLEQYRKTILPKLQEAGLPSGMESEKAQNAARHLVSLSGVLKEIQAFKNVQLLLIRRKEGQPVALSELQNALKALPSTVTGLVDGRQVTIDVEAAKKRVLKQSSQNAVEDPDLQAAYTILDREVELLLSYREGMAGVGTGRAGENPMDVWFDHLVTSSLDASLQEELRLGKDQTQSKSRDALIAKQQEFRDFITQQNQQYLKDLVHHFVGGVEQFTTEMFIRSYAGDADRSPSERPKNFTDLSGFREDMTKGWEMQKGAIQEHRKLLNDVFDLKITDELDRKLMQESAYQPLRFHGVMQMLDALARANAIPKVVKNRLVRFGMQQTLPDGVTDYLDPKVTFSEEAHKALEGLRKGWELPATVTFQKDGQTVTENFNPWNPRHWEVIPPEQWARIQDRIRTTLQVLGAREQEVKGNYARVESDAAVMDALWKIRHPLDLANTQPDQALYDQLVNRDSTVEQCLADKDRLANHPEELAAVWLYVMLEFHGHMDVYAESAGVTIGDLTHLAGEKAKAHTGIMDMARENSWKMMTFILLAYYSRKVYLSWKHASIVKKAAIGWHLTGGALKETGKDIAAIPGAVRWSARNIRTMQERSQFLRDLRDQNAPIGTQLQRVRSAQDGLAAEQQRLQRSLEQLATETEGDILPRFEQISREISEIRQMRLQAFEEEARLLNEQFNWVRTKPRMTTQDIPLRRMAQDQTRSAVRQFQRRFNAFCEEFPEARRIVAGRILTGEPLEEGLWQALEQAHVEKGVAKKMEAFLQDVPQEARLQRMKEADRLMRLGLAGETTAEDVLRLEALEAARMSRLVATGAVALEVFVSAYMLVENERQIVEAEKARNDGSLAILHKRRLSLIASATGGVSSGLLTFSSQLARLSLPTAIAVGGATFAAEQLYERAQELSTLSSNSLKEWPSGQLLQTLSTMTRDGAWVKRWPHAIGNDADLRRNVIEAYLDRRADVSEFPQDRGQAERWFHAEISAADRAVLIRRHGSSEEAIRLHVLQEIIPRRRASAVEQGKRYLDFSTRTFDQREPSFDVNKSGPEGMQNLMKTAQEVTEMFAQRDALNQQGAPLRWSFASVQGRRGECDLSQLPELVPMEQTPRNMTIIAQVHEALAQFRLSQLWKMRTEYLLAGEVRGAMVGESQGWKEAADLTCPRILRSLAPTILTLESKILNGFALSDFGSGRNALTSQIPQNDLQKKVALYELRVRLQSMSVDILSVMLNPDCQPDQLAHTLEKAREHLQKLDGRLLFNEAEAKDMGSPRFNPLKYALEHNLWPQGASSVYETNQMRESATKAAIVAMEKRAGGIPLEYCVSALIDG